MEEKLTKEDLILVYILMSVDGEVSEEESAKFEELLDAYDLKGSKNSLIGTAQDILAKLSPSEKDDMATLYALYKEYIMKNAVGKPLMLASIMALDRFGNSRKRFLLWIMVNMAFADQVISENERKLLSEVAQHINLEWSVVEEMIDAAKALYALEIQKNWLKTKVVKPYEEIEPFVTELEKNQEVIKKNIELLFEI